MPEIRNFYETVGLMGLASFYNFRTRQVDDFTSRLLEIHRKMMEINKEEVI
jgi:hypothetical protein